MGVECASAAPEMHIVKVELVFFDKDAVVGRAEIASGARERTYVFSGDDSHAFSEEFTSRWLPACARLGLRFVAHFHDGSLTTVSTDDVQFIVADLQRLRAWATASEASAHKVERIDGILRSLQETASEGCEHDFG